MLKNGPWVLFGTVVYGVILVTSWGNELSLSAQCIFFIETFLLWARWHDLLAEKTLSPQESTKCFDSDSVSGMTPCSRVHAVSQFRILWHGKPKRDSIPQNIFAQWLGANCPAKCDRCDWFSCLLLFRLWQKTCKTPSFRTVSFHSSSHASLSHFVDVH